MARIIVVTSGKGVLVRQLQRGHRHWFGPEGKKPVVIDFDIGL